MKRLFLTILEGDSPQTARPLMASEDPAIVRAVARELARRLGPDPSRACRGPEIRRQENAGREEEPACEQR
jgi:hypothetical protein